MTTRAHHDARRGARRGAAALLVALLAALTLLAGAAPASAHATLVSSDPTEGEVLTETPDVVTFTFDEPVSLTAEAVQVFDAQGEDVESESGTRDKVITTDLPDELADGNTVALRFKAKVGDKELEGIDFLELDDDGRVAELTVFMRPFSALTAFNEQMMSRLGVSEG